MKTEQLWQELQNSLRELEHPHIEQAMEGFRQLAGELLRWSKVHNLTGHKTVSGIVADMFMDGVAMAGEVCGSDLLDIGSGAGFPGLPLALSLPWLKVTLLEPRAKRVSFQQHATRILKLADRVSSVCQRTNCKELEGITFGTVTLRAVSGIKESLAMAGPYVAKDGCCLLPRSMTDLEEMRELGLEHQKYRVANLPQRLLIKARLPFPT